LLLRAGLADVLALKLLGALQFGLLCGAAAGLAARQRGLAAGSAAAGLLMLGAPSLLGMHTHFLGSTAEAAGPQLLGLWLLVELRRPGLAGRARAALALGAGVSAGLAAVLSLHAWVTAALWVGLLLVRTAGPRRRAAALEALALAGVAAALALPWFFPWDATGPPGPPLSVKGSTPGGVLAMLGWDDVALLFRRLPSALWHGPGGEPSVAPLHGAYVPWALLLALLPALALLGRPRGLRVVAAHALVCEALLLLAGDLLGYPAGYRYYANFLGPAAVLLGCALADGAGWLRVRFGRRAVTGLAAAFAAALLPSLRTLPLAVETELDRPAAAFFAAQHRLAFARRPIHSHFLMFYAYLRDDELPGFCQGYGLHLGREFSRQQHDAGVELRDSARSPGRQIPMSLNPFWLKLQPETWLEPARTLLPAGRARDGFLRGVGLGVAEDGRLDAGDVRLLRAASDGERPLLWEGVGSALGEHAYWLGAKAVSLRVEGGWSEVDGAMPRAEDLAAGMAETAGAAPWSLHEALDGDVPSELRASLSAPLAPRPRRGWALAHPFTYADVGALGRRELLPELSPGGPSAVPRAVPAVPTTPVR
jgi:hypothetical protein